MGNTIKHLAHIGAINHRIDTADTDTIIVLHKFIFEEQTKAEDHERRQDLKNFEGFSLKTNTPEYTKKLQDAQQLTISDFINVATFLA